MLVINKHFWRAFEESGLAAQVRSNLSSQHEGGNEAAARVQALYPDLYMTCGTAPVQIEGTLPTGQWLYFRSRGCHWSVTIAPTEDVVFDESEHLFYRTARYGSDFDASWMPHVQAWALVAQCVEEFLGACSDSEVEADE